MRLKEAAKLAARDASILEDMAARLRAIEFEILSSGHAAHIERQRAEDLAPQVIKVMAEYI